MSVAAMAWAWGQEAGSPGAKVVLMALADHANDEGICWPGQDTVARKSEMTSRAVRDNMARLVDRGLLEVRERRRPDGGQASNLYVLRLAEGSSGGAAPGDRGGRKQASTHEPSVEPSKRTPPTSPSSRGVLTPGEEPVGFAQWLGFHVIRATETFELKMSVPRPATSYRTTLAQAFAALQAEGYTAEDFELASLGVLSDDFMRHGGHVKPENVLRKQKIGGRIDAGRRFRESGGEGGSKYGAFDE